MYNRDPKLWSGGDMVQLIETMQALEDMGDECDFSSNPKTDFSKYDMVHSFHVNFDWSVPPAVKRKALDLPYVLSSIFYPVDYGVPFDVIGRMVRDSKATIALSEAEKVELVNLTGAPGEKIHVIPNGVDPAMWRRGRKADGPAITFARVSPEKGLYQTAKACRDLGIPYYIYGQTGFDSNYERVLTQTGAVLMGQLRQELLAEAVRHASVYVCSSLSERQSLGVLEAAACGLPIVDSIYNRGSSLLPSSLVIDPNVSKDLREAIEKQRKAPDNFDTVPTWKEVAQKIRALYES